MDDRLIEGPFEMWASHPSGEFDVHLQFKVLFDPPAPPRVVLLRIAPELSTFVLDIEDIGSMKDQALEFYWDTHPAPEPDPDRED